MNEPTSGLRMKTDAAPDRRAAAPDAGRSAPPAIVLRDVNLWYGAKQALYDISHGHPGSR